MDRDQEKADFEVNQIEGEKTQSPNLVDDDVSEEEGKKIIWRVDRRLVTLVGVLYCISLMDRTNLSAAAIAGMNEELHLVGERYSVVTLVFFITYIIFQPPSTVLIRKLGPRIYLPTITFAWGAVMIGFGFAPTYEVLMGLRLILGAFEAGYFPGCLHGIPDLRWAEDIQSFTFLVALPQLARVITCLLASLGYWLLVDFPESKRKSWRFLNERQRAWVVRRVNADRGDVEAPKFRIGLFLKSGLDLRVWGYALIAFCSNTLTYSLAYFLPLILYTNLGFSRGASACLIAPPYAFSGFYMYFMGWLGDRYHLRGPIVVTNMVIALIGLPILGWHPTNGVRYFGAFFVTAGANANIPASLAYQANNIRGQWKRAFCSALWVVFASIGGIADPKMLPLGIDLDCTLA
ncbi:hypothetical protein Daesc_005409 [Daldinia eschscholtzii]|uniref:Major facilitator superfamily (MFS) profile domain-containing protein n=1 Tax=Daldinia eschscholtzii TaxID=292717 RepID=A0AAX6MKF7_9PEZI